VMANVSGSAQGGNRGLRVPGRHLLGDLGDDVLRHVVDLGKEQGDCPADRDRRSVGMTRRQSRAAPPATLASGRRQSRAAPPATLASAALPVTARLPPPLRWASAPPHPARFAMEVYDLLVIERGWSLDEWEAWVAESSAALLLGGPVAAEMSESS
jgi:hypothetical protein